MLYKLTIYLAFLLSSLCFVDKDGEDVCAHKEYQISVHHPALESEDGIEMKLIALCNKQGKPTEYYMDVLSVYCAEGVCQVDTVRIVWDIIGRYKRYELNENVVLEKAEGVLFNNDEYKQLDAILKNKNSRFKNLQLNDIVRKDEEEHGVDVDAFSGATAIVFESDETIKGASLTCYALWHWANNPLSESIQKITAKSLSQLDLTMLLGGNDAGKTNFAIEELNDRKAYDKELVSKLIDAVCTDELIIKKGISYLENAPDELYLLAIEKLLTADDKKLRIAALQSVEVKYSKAPKAFCSLIAHHLSSINSYQELDVALEILASYDKKESIVNQVLPLLDKDILLARRAYYFLEGVQLEKKQERAVERFYRKNKDYL